MALHQTTLNHLKQIHAHLITTQPNPNPSTLASLIQRYILFSAPDSARLVVDHGPTSTPFLLNTLIKCSNPRDSIILFSNWITKPGPRFDDRTYIFTLGACARSGTVSALWEGKQIHCRVVKNGFVSDLVVATTAVHFYGCYSAVGDARKVFDEMPVRNSAAWNALIKGFCKRECGSVGDSWRGYLLFKEMMLADEVPTGTTMVCVLSVVSELRLLEIGAGVHGYIEKRLFEMVDDVYIGTGLVEMYSKCRDLGSALMVFHRMQERNVLTWTVIITGFVARGRGREAMELLDEMKSTGVRPNVVTLTSLISACCRAGLVDECLKVFHAMEREFMIKPDIRHYDCIINLLGRVGRLEEAYGLLKRRPLPPEPVLWRSLLSACKVHGNRKWGNEVAKMLHRKYPQTCAESLS